MHPATLSEVFGSVVGEGVHAGSRAVFVRFAGCNLACSYCDTRYARTPTDTWVLHLEPEPRTLENPVACRELIGLVRQGFRPAPTAVLTGGEPLVQEAAAGEIAAGLREAGYRVHLETNGTLPRAFRAIKRHIDFVSMDIKLPSTQGGKSFEREHLDFLMEIRDVRGAVKVVVTGDGGDGEIGEAVDLVADVNPHLPFLIQPAYTDAEPAAAPKRLLRLQELASRKLRDVRISIQMHRILGLR
jgi:organic radical activating enzyme